MTSELERTDWFPCEILPMYVGDYEARFRDDDIVAIRHWDGAMWNLYLEDSTVPVPSPTFGLRFGHQWRGLAQPYIAPESQQLELIGPEDEEL